MKKNISLLILLMASGLLASTRSPKRVRFASDATIIGSPIATRSSSGSDASTGSSSTLGSPKDYLEDLKLNPDEVLAQMKATFKLLPTSSSPKNPTSLRDESLNAPQGDLFRRLYSRKPGPILSAAEIDEIANRKSEQNHPVASFNPLTGYVNELSVDQERDIKHKAGKDALLQGACLRKRFLAFMGCTPHVRPKVESEKSIYNT